MPELIMSSPYVHSKVDSTTFTTGNPWPQSTLWIDRHFGFGLRQSHRLQQRKYIGRSTRHFLASNYNRNVHLPNLSQSSFSLWNRQSLPMQADRTGGVEPANKGIRATRHRLPYFFIFLFQSFTPLKADEVRPQQNKLIKSLSAVNFHKMDSICNLLKGNAKRKNLFSDKFK